MPAPQESAASSLEMSQLLARVFPSLIETGEERRNQAVENGLKIVGEFLRVERRYVFLFRREDGEMVMDNTHEWCAAGATSEKDRLQGVPVSRIAGSMDLFTRGGSAQHPACFRAFGGIRDRAGPARVPGNTVRPDGAAEGFREAHGVPGLRRGS